MSKVKKAVIPVSGLGTRFLPITKAIPKEMLPIVDMPIIYYNVLEAVKSGITDILIISTSRKPSIENYFNKNEYLENKVKDKKDLLEKLKLTNLDVNITFMHDDEPRGNGKTVLLAKDFVGNEPFALMWGDDVIKSETPALKQLIDVYDKYGYNVLATKQVDPELVSKYGIMKFKNEEELEIEYLIEKPKKEEAPSNYAVIGRYIVEPEVFNELEHIGTRNGEYYFTDALAKVLEYQQGHACLIKGTYFDTGSKLGYMKACTSYALDDPEIKKEYLEYLKEIIK